MPKHYAALFICFAYAGIADFAPRDDFFTEKTVICVL